MSCRNAALHHGVSRLVALEFASAYNPTSSVDSTVILSLNRLAEVKTVTRDNAGSRFQLWVDAVGGFLVCLNDEVTIGQALPNTPVDIPIVGDLSRRHAKIRREGEGYVLSPYQSVRVAGRDVEQLAVLSDGDEIELGRSVVMRFRQPHPFSTTGRLELLTNHRSQPLADAVLLMADSCILGPSTNNHVICRDWSDDLILFRRQRQLHCRSRQMMEIDGVHRGKTGEIGTTSRICGADFCLSLEPID